MSADTSRSVRDLQCCPDELSENLPIVWSLCLAAADVVNVKIKTLKSVTENVVVLLDRFARETLNLGRKVKIICLFVCSTYYSRRPSLILSSHNRWRLELAKDNNKCRPFTIEESDNNKQERKVSFSVKRKKRVTCCFSELWSLNQFKRLCP